MSNIVQVQVLSRAPDLVHAPLKERPRPDGGKEVGGLRILRAAMPHYHPTLAEIWTYPAEELAEQL